MPQENGPQAWLQAIIEASPVGLIVVQRTGEISLVNAATEALFEYSQDELIGAKVEILLPDRFTAAHRNHRQAYSEAPTAREMGKGRELVARKRSGAEFPVEVGLTPFQMNQQEFIVASVLDVTLQKEREREVVRMAQIEAEKSQLEQFASIASHDLRSPLNSISHVINFIRDDDESLSQSTRSHLETIEARLNRMTRLLNDLTMYAKVSGAIPSIEQVDVASLIEQVADSLAIPDRFRLDVKGPLPILQTYRTHLEQVFLNLIGNALKHHHLDCGQIQITAADQGDKIEFCVSDDGPGIAPEYQQRIFGMFKTLQSRDRVEGSGLGLSIVRKIIVRYGGEVTVTSAVGRGSSFQFTWPKQHQ